jgi:dUTP pyrophosphatase
MKVKIKRIDKSLPLPVYETKKSVGFDLITRKDTLIKKKEIGLVPCNVIIEVPKGFIFVVTSRSSTPKKKGLLMPHGIGIIDQDYCGPKDEVLAQFYNFSAQDVLIKRGEKIAQGIFLPVKIIQWQEEDEIKKENRGGFGSTDNN